MENEGGREGGRGEEREGEDKSHVPRQPLDNIKGVILSVIRHYEF